MPVRAGSNLEIITFIALKFSVRTAGRHWPDMGATANKKG